MTNIIDFDFELAREALELNVDNIKFKTKSGNNVKIIMFSDPDIWIGDYLVVGFYYYGEDNKPMFSQWTKEGMLRNDGLETDLDLVIEITEI